MSDQKILLVVILGPTAVGKSTISIQLAEKLNGEIISADSRLFYRGMDIGTAKPSKEELRRVPHYLVDIANPDEILSLALFIEKADEAIRKIYENQHVPFLVGGTGQFIRSITEGWQIPTVAPNPRLRQALQHWSINIGATALHTKLSMLDPEAASSIEPANIRRTIRALEVILTTGKRFSDQKLSGQQRYHTLSVGLTMPREELYRRIDERIDEMIAAGFVDEVKNLLDKGYSPSLPTLSAIGYAEIIACLKGDITIDEAIILMKRRTRSFVRRQANWFKENDPDIHWFNMTEANVGDIEKFIKETLKNRMGES